ncbi:MAG: glycine cleavage system protein GcvH [Spirochaetales bacterium]|nr:glycine cleavage system protein GcvH [Spirochaetales bacterium]
MSNFPQDLMYAKTHEWVKKDGDVYIVGISDFAQSQLGDIVYVDLPGVGTKLESGDSFGELESSKAVSEINMPFSGEIIAVNNELTDSPELINSEPYSSWIIKIKADSEDDFNKLLNSDEAKKIIEG